MKNLILMPIAFLFFFASCKKEEVGTPVVSSDPNASKSIEATLLTNPVQWGCDASFDVKNLKAGETITISSNSYNNQILNVKGDTTIKILVKKSGIYVFSTNSGQQAKVNVSVVDTVASAKLITSGPWYQVSMEQWYPDGNKYVVPIVGDTTCLTWTWYYGDHTSADSMNCPKQSSDQIGDIYDWFIKSDSIYKNCASIGVKSSQKIYKLTKDSLILGPRSDLAKTIDSNGKEFLFVYRYSHIKQSRYSNKKDKYTNF